MFNIAKLMRKGKIDVKGTNFITSDTGEINVEEVEVCGRRWEFFEVVLNGENDRQLEVGEAVDGPLHEITEQEVEMALKGMQNG